MNCPNCQIKVPRDAINIQKDIAQCQSCGNVFSISTHVSPQKETSSDLSDYDAVCQSLYKEAGLYNDAVQQKFEGKSRVPFDINNPPKGAYINHFDDGVQIGATTRSWFALFIIPFATVWSGGSLGGIYGSQILTGEFNILISLFGIPFLIGSVLLWSFALMTVAGKTEITLDSKGGHIFTGVGKIGQHQHFDWNDINSVREEVNTSHSRKGGSTTTHYVVLEGQKQIRFGRFLGHETRYYVLKTLQELIKNRR